MKLIYKSKGAFTMSEQAEKKTRVRRSKEQLKEDYEKQIEALKQKKADDAAKIDEKIKALQDKINNNSEDKKARRKKILAAIRKLDDATLESIVKKHNIEVEE